MGVCLSIAIVPATAAEQAWPVELPILDAPFNRESATTFPSMAQSLALTHGFYELSHTAIQTAFANSPRAAALGVLGFDLISLWLPLGNGWLHEEWHRAVMGVEGIDSHNGVYDFEFSDVIKVNGVADEQLATHKGQHPANQVRLNSAGIEAQYELNLAFERSAFFYAAPAWVTPMLWLNALNNIAYLHTCATDEANSLTAEITAQEGTDIHERDFTGLDCNAWVYDLFRPEEPYAARGTHPSGVGVDRYRDLNDLSGEEQSYLRRQRNLSLLNLVDPFLFGQTQFVARDPWAGEPMRWNANLRHHLTPFGYNLGINLFLHRSDLQLLAILQTFVNNEAWGPGIDLQLQRRAFAASLPDWRLATRLALWSQPAELTYRAGDFTAGGLAALTLEYGQGALRPFLQAEYKSEGWVAGNEYLGENLALRAGLSLWLDTRPGSK